jgi:putative tricarboxylic transport membrane protein
VVIGAWLLYEAFTGGWRSRGDGPPGFQRASFLWVSAGLIAHMALIGWAGFVVAGTVLFVLVARAFASRSPLRDLAIGLALTVAVYLFFTQALNVSLPAGWMRFML